MVSVPGEQVQEQVGEHPPLRVFQSVPSAPQVDEDHYHDEDDHENNLAIAFQ